MTKQYINTETEILDGILDALRDDNPSIDELADLNHKLCLAAAEVFKQKPYNNYSNGTLTLAIAHAAITLINTMARKEDNFTYDAAALVLDIAAKHCRETMQDVLSEEKAANVIDFPTIGGMQ